jgi:hypothetical protein
MVQVNVVQSMQDLEEYKQRLGDLVVILKERGMDADALFEEAGLNSNRLNSSYFTGAGRVDGIGGSSRFVGKTRHKNQLKSNNDNEELLETPDPPGSGSGIPSDGSFNSPNNSASNLVPVMECFHEDRPTNNALAPPEISRERMSRISDDDSDISA